MNQKALFLLKQIKSRRLDRQKRELTRQARLVDSLSEELDSALQLEEESKQMWANRKTARLESLLSSPMFVNEIEHNHKDVSAAKQSWLDQTQTVHDVRDALQRAEHKHEEDSMLLKRLLKEHEKFGYLCDSVLQRERRKERSEPVT